MNSMRTFVYSVVNRIFGSSPNKLIQTEQEKLFDSLELNRGLGLSKLNQLCIETFGREYSEHNGMWSEHLVFFSSLSVSDFPVKKVLEIGTFKGETTSILSGLFPNAEIISVDLSHQEIRDNGTYSYALDEIQNQSKRKAIKNVQFLETNSVNLLSLDDVFDLIWVDGYHLAPTVVIDISNSVRLLRSGGIALCDDVYLKKTWIEQDSDLSSMQALKVLAGCGLINQKLIYKRVGKKFNNTVIRSKMLGIAIKN